MNSANQEPLVLILMGTFNGERFIREQLDSIAAQRHKNWKLVISDDGSTDHTLEIARQWASELGEGRVVFREGPRKGFAQNFLSMACDKSLISDFYAFCDQDDVWMEEKLMAAVHVAQKNEHNFSSRDNEKIASSGADLFLYCGRTAYVGEDLNIYQYSRRFKKPPSFANAIVQSLAGGNTMLFNYRLKKVLEHIGVVPTTSHDWWLYQLVTGAGGQVFYDENPYILYRQSLNTLVGENQSLGAKLKRVRMSLAGLLGKYIDQNISCWEGALQYLNNKNKKILKTFKECRNYSIFRRIFYFWSLGIHRQSALQTLALYALLVIKKI